MADIPGLLTTEARSLDPLFQIYRSAPNAANGGNYVIPALRWLAEAQYCLRTATLGDPLAASLGARYNVVVSNLNKISDAGHYPQAGGSGSDKLGDFLAALRSPEVLGTLALVLAFYLLTRR